MHLHKLLVTEVLMFLSLTSNEKILGTRNLFQTPELIPQVPP